jgi:hypothetical protein
LLGTLRHRLGLVWHLHRRRKDRRRRNPIRHRRLGADPALFHDALHRNALPHEALPSSGLPRGALPNHAL